MGTACSSGDRIEIKVPCKPEYVRTVRRAIADFAQSIDMPQSAVEAVEIAASEAVANIVRHAYDDAHRALSVRVKCSHRRNGLLLEVADRGRGFSAPSANSMPEVDLDREGGFGIVLMKSLMDRVNYVSKPDEGTRIRMTKKAREAVARLSRSTDR
jgi:anti-sigma regulatory factor (Ser/Thr protein kinase)